MSEPCNEHPLFRREGESDLQKLLGELRQIKELLFPLRGMDSIEKRLATIEAVVRTAAGIRECDGDQGHGKHTLTMTCPVACLEPILPARPYNCIHWKGDFRTVFDVVEGVKTKSLLGIRNFGEGSLKETATALIAAGVLNAAEIDI